MTHAMTATSREQWFQRHFDAKISRLDGEIAGLEQKLRDVSGKLVATTDEKTIAWCRLKIAEYSKKLDLRKAERLRAFVAQKR